ncbi:hypothetical protein FC62_GL001438 [Amylolactobacillus amylotrophicus DSM 20534]|uniref:Uncharacterized protein n=3 Tax=Amylolactobacillus TaxID=2767876 RepID=A0A1L6XAM7_9LACO|nr:MULTISPECIES: SHOCT domain-containing protein [Amylolactobacillus]APT18030.1 hypothetical protein LA20533_01290 [Amylolactobacillus amylophilus DSM 20533 = JCM 1125]KRK37322.1 hypothetical protein FC62_GL001438 [Amylolactobacillus amylotrophicus DSM 20534]KRM41721.1 hypothetical protein FD40_GL001284 [Amylolactobacillus amylophilus DSM 20533 = JCM 1125]GED80682.1 hypothetical protein LAM01_11550 [Amylolactobacillus amylophilus]
MEQVTTCGKHYFLRFDDDNLYYKNKNDEEKTIPLNQTPYIRFLNPKIFSVKGTIHIILNNDIVDLIPFELLDSDNLNTFTSKFNDAISKFEKSSITSNNDNYKVINQIKYSNSGLFINTDQDVLINLATQLVPSSEMVIIMLKGDFKEFLIVTDQTLYIIKSGYMTGHMIGQGNFSMPLTQVSNTSVDFHFMSGYFTVSAPGLQNTPKNYWSTDRNLDPAKAPNTISLGAANKDLFIKATQIINTKLIPELRNPLNSAIKENKVSTADELRSFKSLLDDGIITQDEFEAKKKQLLDL